MNRKRLKGEFGTVDTRRALNTLFSVLLSMIEMMASFTPFITDYMYNNLRKVILDENYYNENIKNLDGDSEVHTTNIESVHYLLHSAINEELIDVNVERQVSLMQTVIEVGRVLRDRRNMPLKYPLPEVVIITNSSQTIDDIDMLKQFILDELNVKDIKLSMNKEEYGVQLRAEPDIKALGLRLRNDSKKVVQAIRNLTNNDLVEYEKDPENFMIEGYKMQPGDLKIRYTLSESGLDKNLAEKYEADSQNGILVLLNVCADSTMIDEGTAREIINRVQKLRKEAKLVPSDPIRVYYKVLPIKEITVDLARVCSEFSEYIQNTLKADFINLDTETDLPKKNYRIQSKSDIKGETIELMIESLSTSMDNLQIENN